MKKLLALLLALIMVFTLATCGSKTDTEDPSSDPGTADTPKETVETKPITPDPKPMEFGSFTLTAEHIPFAEPFMVSTYKQPSLDVLGNTVYISDGDKKISTYTYEGGALTFVKEIEVSDTGDSISVDGNGNIYADGGVFEAKIYDADGNETGKAAASGEITVSKTADFAIAHFPGREAVTKISGGAGEDWVINKIGSKEGPGKFDNVNAAKIQGDHVLVGGADTEKGLIAAYDYDGNQIFVSTDDPDGNLPEILGETANGFMSTSVGTLNLFSADGKLIAAEDTDDLFGIESGWIYGLATLEDGSFLALVTNHTQDADNSELLLYKVTGF